MSSSNNDRALEKIELAENRVIHSISETMDLYGVTPSTGRLYATMYFKEEMTLDEMGSELGMSKPSMSTGIKKLQENEMVNKVFQKGSRKYNFRAEKDFFESFGSFFCNMWDREVNANLPAVREAKTILQEVMDDQTVSSVVRDDAKKKYHLLDESEKYYEWLARLSKSVRSKEIYEFLPKEEK